MKNLSTILCGLILFGLLVFILKVSTPDVPKRMVFIPAGDGMDAFYMDVYEVTNADYKKFIDANPQWQKDKALISIVGNKYLSVWDNNMYPKGKANHPVVNVSWFAAKAYAEWVGKDLPTDAQWERAARGTPVGKRYNSVASITFGFPAARATLIERKYPWGDAEPQSRANYNRYTPTTDFSDPPTKEVGSYFPNEYGLYDMVGNVAEWCLDGLNFDDIRGRYHRVRGGSWFDGAEGIRITRKSQYPVDGAVATLGFRCASSTAETNPTTKVATEMASFLYDEMRNQFDNVCYSVSKGYAAHTDLNLKFAEIVTSNTGYPRTFGKELIRIFREVNAEQMEPDSFSERLAINHDLMLRLWRLYLEIHFEHSEKSAYEKLRLFKENLTENMNDIIVPDRS
ncbi:MAG: SUMF1/EgtB/PvdO family nonheme iron enzyme [Candidatus Poribacteria bacterium]|nr:SUMF1/EgtB/PvdO family nonheme iron enzyme [Candidatus Poribacteria bacterium]